MNIVVRWLGSKKDLVKISHRAWGYLTSEEQHLRSFTGFMPQRNIAIDIVLNDMFNELIKMTDVIWYALIKAGVTCRRICSRKLALFILPQSILNILVKIIPCGHSKYPEKVILMESGFKTGIFSLYIAAEYQQRK